MAQQNGIVLTSNEFVLQIPLARENPWNLDSDQLKEYVRNQLQEDIASDQMCLKEFKDPFTGEPVVKGK